MRFYKINMQLKTENCERDEAPTTKRYRNLADRDFGAGISKQCEKYTEKIVDKGYFFVSSAIRSECIFGLITRKDLDVEKYISEFDKARKLNVVDLQIKETTLSEFAQMLQDAERNGFIYDAYEILREYELDSLVGRGGMVGNYGLSFDEIILRPREKDAIYLASDNYFTKDSFNLELDRIFAGNIKKKTYGHPVDYLIESDDERTKKGVTQLLLQALYNTGRIVNRRYCEIEFDSDTKFSRSYVDSLYKTCVGGSVVVSFNADDMEQDDIAHGEFYFIEDFCEIARKHCRDVLTILCLPRECKNLRMAIFENMGNCTFVEIKEKQAIGDEAINYLKKRAREYNVRTDKKLLSIIDKDRGYLASELNEIFDEWYNVKLKTTIFSQYKELDTVKKEIVTKKPKGSAYDELESMIGLSSAKKVIRQALDCYKAQKVFRDKGMQEDSFCNHMIFTGNPGTAKTTVARLFARIMKDNDILSKGNIVEVGRGDLVGRYVGWTAPIIKRRFKEAKGGILFIDEAYSLVDDRDGSFGDEAINTIVQEMENHRDDVIVIFAGYPDKMDGFLDKNPGLRSRIAHHIHFDDYSADELCMIAKHIAKQKNLIIEDEAMEKIRDIMEEVCHQPDFGNGRYVRNVIEKAKMAQNSRLMKMDYDSVTAVDVKKICSEDIEMPGKNVVKVVHKIGFAIA